MLSALSSAFCPRAPLGKGTKLHPSRTVAGCACDCGSRLMATEWPHPLLFHPLYLCPSSSQVRFPPGTPTMFMHWFVLIFRWTQQRAESSIEIICNTYCFKRYRIGVLCSRNLAASQQITTVLAIDFYATCCQYSTANVTVLQNVIHKEM